MGTFPDQIAAHEHANAEPSTTVIVNFIHPTLAANFLRILNRNIEGLDSCLQYAMVYVWCVDSVRMSSVRAEYSPLQGWAAIRNAINSGVWWSDIFKLSDGSLGKIRAISKDHDLQNAAISSSWRTLECEVVPTFP